MNEARFFRVANQLELWDGTKSPAEVAHALAGEKSWSLFLRMDSLDPIAVLAAFYGWRSGRGPLHDYAYVVFTEVELKLSGGILIRTPEHFTYGWPPEVRDAHYDLENHTPAGALAFAKAVAPLGNRLTSVPRLEVLLAQHELSLREDAPVQFVASVKSRLSKLSKNEEPVMAALRVVAETRGLLPP